MQNRLVYQSQLWQYINSTNIQVKNKLHDNKFNNRQLYQKSKPYNFCYKNLMSLTNNLIQCFTCTQRENMLPIAPTRFNQIIHIKILHSEKLCYYLLLYNFSIFDYTINQFSFITTLCKLIYYVLLVLLRLFERCVNFRFLLHAIEALCIHVCVCTNYRIQVTFHQL